ncbi:MAG: trypsin-like peptidase domain-containing protein [Polyangiaceae bacterium]|nr:trypsin-like peptidase domain-containing protein [Polyangiaceae bacterium]
MSRPPAPEPQRAGAVPAPSDVATEDTALPPELLQAAEALLRAAASNQTDPLRSATRALQVATANAQRRTIQAKQGSALPQHRGRRWLGWWPHVALGTALLGLIGVVAWLANSSPSGPVFRLSRATDEQITGERRLELRRIAKRTSVLVASQHHAGSGFIYSRSGDTVLVVTNAHVVTDRGGELDGHIRVKAPEGSWQAAYPVWLEEQPGQVDIALLAVVDSRRELGQPAVVGSLTATGRYLTCSGFPLGEEFVLSSGYVREARKGAAFKHDCVAERGSSGGPVFDSAGKVVGVTTYLFMPGTQHERAVALDLSEYLSRLRVATTQIDARQGWQPVGVWAERGTRVSLLADGEWSYHPWRARAESRGVHRPERHGEALDPSLPFASLICRVGEGAPAPVNKRWAGSGAGSVTVSDLTAHESGELLCRINDAQLEDNRGAIRVLALARR